MKLKIAKKAITNGRRFRIGMSPAFVPIWMSAARGDGPLLLGQLLPADDGPPFVATNDLDGDQVSDLVVANSLNNNVAVLLGVGDGTFAAAAHYAAGEKPRSGSK